LEAFRTKPVEQVNYGHKEQTGNQSREKKMLHKTDTGAEQGDPSCVLRQKIGSNTRRRATRTMPGSSPWSAASISMLIQFLKNNDGI
jgi:hypothetical protein